MHSLRSGATTTLTRSKSFLFFRRIPNFAPSVTTRTMSFVNKGVPGAGQYLPLNQPPIGSAYTKVGKLMNPAARCRSLISV